MSKLIHQQDNDKISLEKDEMLEDVVYESVSNQWKFRKFESRKIELVKSLCVSVASSDTEAKLRQNHVMWLRWLDVKTNE